jgi:hypothetical protein
MLRTLLPLERTFYITRQEKAPLLREREAFLEHLLQQGYQRCWGTQCVMAIAERHQVAETDTRLHGVWIDEIEEAAKKWTRQQRSNPNIRTYKHSGSYFTYVAKKWLRFAGMLKRSALPRMRFADEIVDFARWMTEKMGLSMMRRPLKRSRCSSEASGNGCRSPLRPDIAIEPGVCSIAVKR